MDSWMLDDKIDLIAVCEKAEWHRLAAVEMLQAKGLNRADAETFAEFGFDEKAGGSRSKGLTEAQWNRLSLA